jgi:hypothetical protein
MSEIENNLAKFEALLKENNNWEFELFLIIKRETKRVAEKYNIGGKELPKVQLRFFIDTIKIIAESSHGKYLILNEDKLKTSREKIYALLTGAESFYELNKKETIKLLNNYFILPLVKELELKKKIRIHRNQKGKEWREDLYELAEKEYTENLILDKTKALKTAFEKLPDKDSHRKEFDLKYDSIYRTFIKKV